MDGFIAYLIQFGGPGMFVAAFLAGSFFPFSSELVMVGLLAAGVNPNELLLWGTAGNTLGSLFNYGVGSLGKDECRTVDDEETQLLIETRWQEQHAGQQNELLCGKYIEEHSRAYLVVVSSVEEMHHRHHGPEEHHAHSDELRNCNL